jgi:hypothetical protein
VELDGVDLDEILFEQEVRKVSNSTGRLARIALRLAPLRCMAARLPW